MKKPFFSAEDFDSEWGWKMADIANAKLEEYLKTLPRVYNRKHEGGFELNWSTERCRDTHTALLWDVKEIE